MHHLPVALAELARLDRPLGDERMEASVGPWRFVIEGLDAEGMSALAARLDGFAPEGPADAEAISIAVRRAPRPHFLTSSPGELYRVIGGIADEAPVCVSYAFAVWGERASRWSIAVAEPGSEPLARSLDNALRCIVTRLAAGAGGFALHGGGVLREGRGHVFAGGSGAGKSTAVRASAPARSLGDDFAIALPGPEGWTTAAVPFDNAGVAPSPPPRGLVPLAGIWRLFQAEASRVDVPKGAAAAASLFSCVAMPWAIPDLSGSLTAAVARFVVEGRFGHLHFRPEGGFWPLLDDVAPLR